VSFEHSLILILESQALAFALSWALTFLFGHRLRVGHWLASLLYFAAVEAAAMATLLVTGNSAFGPSEWAPACVVGVLVVALTEDWNALGQVSMATTVTLSLSYLVYLGYVTALSHLGYLSVAFSLVLIALQASALVLLCAGGHEMLDVLCRIRWRRVAAPVSIPGYAPRVSLHVPTYNEPPDMVRETLEALAHLDYPNFEVLVIDNNTKDEALWHPLQADCARLGFTFIHVDNWPGFKSGALNLALTRMDPATEIVGVVDSDYVVERDYVSACVGHFHRPEVAFVQTPQDYREVNPGDVYAQACYDSYSYFFSISMASRNEHNGIIFAGTMGLIRRSVLQELGGWDEWCITEDAEISLRILDRGYQSVFLDHSYGKGLMPLNFEGLKKQRFRWAFGGMQILRRHWGSLLPWARLSDPSHSMTLAQQRDYLMGGLQWLNDPVTFAFTVLLLLGAGALVFAHSLFIQTLAPAVTFVPFLFIFVGLSRFLWALRVKLGCGPRRAVAAFMVLTGLTWVVTVACTLGLTKREGVFLRTPKKRTGADPWHAMRVVSQETTLVALCVAAAATLSAGGHLSRHVWVVVGLLGWQGFLYAAAPICSVLGLHSEMRALHPQYFASSKNTGQRSNSMVSDRAGAWTIAGLAALVLLAFVLAVRLAPEAELAYRTRPTAAGLVPSEIAEPAATPAVRAALYFEKEAAVKGDVEAALRLWSPDGVIRDANYTLDDPTDDTVWVGTDEIRERYTQEFARHQYLELRHSDASVIIEGDTAVVVNDLHAKLRTPAGVQDVFLSRGDRWKFVRGPHGWRIAELIMNRAPR
jgi:cellulose synthase/poly-beta-1,6-N-acetylglucosamine synthase-like glycosyltransferase/ketosteroid isomerase-like protein